MYSDHSVATHSPRLQPVQTDLPLICLPQKVIEKSFLSYSPGRKVSLSPSKIQWFLHRVPYPFVVQDIINNITLNTYLT